MSRALTLTLEAAQALRAMQATRCTEAAQLAERLGISRIAAKVRLQRLADWGCVTRLKAGNAAPYVVTDSGRQRLADFEHYAEFERQERLQSRAGGAA